MKYLVLCLMLVSFQASSAELLIGLYTQHHTTEDQELNEINKFRGILFENNLAVITFVNSFEKRSNGVMYQYPVSSYGSINIGAVTGYEDTPSSTYEGLSPVVSVSLKWKRLRLDVTPSFSSLIFTTALK